MKKSIDALAFVNRVLPVLDPKKHKGNYGRIAIVGGSKVYTGAPVYSAKAA